MKGKRKRFMLSPNTASSAGSSVSEATRANKTTMMTPMDGYEDGAAGQYQTGQGQQHDHPGVEHRPAGGVAGKSDSLQLGSARFALAAVAADDEQRVVYSHRHPH